MQMRAIAKKNFPKTGLSSEFIVNSFSFLLILLAAVFFAVRMFHGWTFIQFQDEGQDLVAALAIHHGDRLYQDFIYQHGPAVVMLTQLYGTITGWGDITYARIIPSVLASLAGLSIATSPALPSRTDKFIGASLFFGILSSVWLPQFLYIDSYHTMGGTAIVIGLALFVVPAWQQDRVSCVRAAGAGVAFTFAAAAAYTFAPGSGLLMISAILALPAEAHRRELVTAFVAGAGSTTMLCAVWLFLFGSFSGYLAFHIVLNQIFYSPYMHLTFFKCLHSFIPSLNPSERPHAIGLICLYAAFISLTLHAHFSRKLARRSVAIMMGVAGMMLLNGRCSSGFPDGCFLVACIGSAALILPRWRNMTGLTKASASTLAIICLAGLAIAGAEYTARHSAFSREQIITAQPYHYGRDDQPLSVEIRRILRPEERFLALVYNPILYLSANRLPMRKYVAYFPWEADYARHPWFGRNFDICADLPRHLPKLIYFDNWTVWNKYKPAQYMPCLAGILATRYRTDPGFPLLHIRAP